MLFVPTGRRSKSIAAEAAPTESCAERGLREWRPSSAALPVLVPHFSERIELDRRLLLRARPETANCDRTLLQRIKAECLFDVDLVDRCGDVGRCPAGGRGRICGSGRQSTLAKSPSNPLPHQRGWKSINAVGRAYSATKRSAVTSHEQVLRLCWVGAARLLQHVNRQPPRCIPASMRQRQAVLASEQQARQQIPLVAGLLLLSRSRSDAGRLRLSRRPRHPSRAPAAPDIRGH